MAILCGITTSILLEAILLMKRENFPVQEAFKVACGMSLISMITMEIAMNLVDMNLVRHFGWTLSDVMYWLAFVPALIAGFLSAWPYNYWRLVKFNKACH